MRKLYHKILDKLNVSGRDFSIFLLSLLLAFSVWLIHNLSFKYSTYLSVPVQVKANIDGHTNLSADINKIVARCKTTGYNALRNSSFTPKKTKIIEFDPSIVQHKGGEIFYITRANLAEYSHIFYGGDVTLEYFLTDTLFFRLPYQAHKKVPIQPVTSITYQSQYINQTPLKIEPDSVILYGEPLHLSNIDKVYTENIRLKDINASVQGLADLKSISGVRMSSSEVHFYLDVTRFVEIKASLPVHVINVPRGGGLTPYPPVVDVSFICMFPKMSDPREEVMFYVDYNDFLDSKNGECILRVSELPAGVISYKVNSPVIECVANLK